MKKIILVLFMLYFFPCYSNNFPILSKFYKFEYADFLPTGYYTSKLCNVYMDRIEIIKKAEELTSTQIKNIKIDGPILEIIEEVKQAIISTQMDQKNEPTTIYLAYFVVGENRYDKINLGSKNGNSFITKNESIGAIKLRNFLDLNCN